MKEKNHVVPDEVLSSQPLKSKFWRDIPIEEYLADFSIRHKSILIALLKLYAAAAKSRFATSPKMPL